MFDSQQSTSMPFCSERCRLVDLGRWLQEGYGLPHMPDDEGEEAPDELPDDQES
jgi:uncharacterized protein